MNKIAASAVLLFATIDLAGCNTVPQPQTAQTNREDRRSSGGDQYDRTYQAESRHHHHRGRGEQTSNDDWTSYDRPDDSSSRDGGSGDFRPRQRDRRNADNDEARTNRPDRHHNSRAVAAAPGQFDFYVLNLSWSPEFCHGHPAAAECTQRRGFTLHGLWPQNNDGTYPEDCSEASGPASPSQYADIYPDPSLLQHEWQTHGTCSALSPDAFFGVARRAEQSIAIPSELSHPTQQTSLTPAQIVTAFTRSNPSLPESSVAISCGNNYLTAVEICMDKHLKPESCSQVKSCGANVIRIPAPQ